MLFVDDALADFPEPPLFPADLLSLEAAPLEEPPAESVAVAELPEDFGFSFSFFLSPFLKSVSYQPVPFNLKAAAEMSFFRDASLHSGQ